MGEKENQSVCAVSLDGQLADLLLQAVQKDQDQDQDQDQSLKNYFTMEEAGIACPYRVESEEDRRAREILEATTKRVGNRFETGLLWRTDKVQMPDSYSMAYRRMQSLEQRFRKNPDLQLKVAEAVEGFIEKGYAHKALPGELRSSKPGQEWYLPYRSG